MKRIERVEDHENEDYAEHVIDEECDLIEDLLGSSFVLCQTYITCVRYRVQRLRKAIARHDPGLVSRVPLTKKGILRAGSTAVRGCGHSKVQVIDSFANYFKHRVEWPPYWNRIEGDQAKRTVAVIRKVGAEEGCSGNMRRAARALGNEGYCDLGVFQQALDTWRSNLIEQLRNELVSGGLL